MWCPNIAQRAAALFAVFVGSLSVAACGTPAPTLTAIPTATAAATVAPTTTPTLPPAPPPLVTLPEDEAPHDSPVEWWYFSGLLTDDAGNDYSYHFVTFQGEGPPGAVPHLMHASLGDHTRGNHYAAETPTLAPVAADAVSVDIEGDGWAMRGDGDAYQLRFSLGGLTLEFEAVSRREPVLHGGTGLVSLGPVGDTYYYSRTRLESAGFIEGPGGQRPVSGTSWMDHQWGDLSGRGVGWDWLGLHLDTGADFMAAVVWDPETRERFAAYGTYIGPDGEVAHLNGRDISLAPTGSWTSPETGISYPMSWTLEVPALDLRLEVVPVLQQSEFAISGFITAAYWEGAVTALGTMGDAPMGGLGFMELVGYDPNQLEVRQ